jgi:focal adhesion kinase 1
MRVICFVLLQPTFIADFSHVQSITISNIGGDAKWNVQMKIVNAVEPLTLTCVSSSVAENLASLVEGYCRLVSGDPQMTVWKRTGKFHLSS